MSPSLMAGFMNFAGVWANDVCVSLFKGKATWNYAKGAPKGPHRKIVHIETAALFVTAAKRAAANNRLFEGPALVKAYLDGELRPHGLTFDGLSAAAKKKAVARVRKAIADDMAVPVYFGLFDELKKRTAYRLTDTGLASFERLKPLMPGFMDFADFWANHVCVALLNGNAWDYEERAPKGAHRKIVHIETAALFVTAAKRAVVDNRLFEGPSLVGAYLAGELAPQGLAVANLSAEVKKVADARIKKIIADDMSVLVFFGLFEELKNRATYRLTDKGVTYYEKLANPRDVMHRSDQLSYVS